MAEPMLCPIDKTPLVMSARQNIEIDYCPTCRGVWLDRGELDKIIERSAAEVAAAAGPAAAAPQAPPPPPAPFAPPPQAPYPPQQGYPQRHYGDHERGYDHYRHKRRKSWLEDIFD